MIIKRYKWEEENTPTLPYLDLILNKFDNVIVVTNDDGKVAGYSGYNELDSRYLVTSFWTSKNNEVAQKALLEELKKELNFNRQKRIGMNIDKEDDDFIKLLRECGWYIHLSDVKMDIYEPSRACYQLSIPPDEIETLRKIDESRIDKKRD